MARTKLNQAPRGQGRARQIPMIQVRHALSFLLGSLALIVVVYVGWMVRVFRHHLVASPEAPANAVPAPSSPRLSNITSAAVLDATSRRNYREYSDWRQLAVELAALDDPSQILDILKSQDPFGVRRFEERLLQEESDRQAILSLEDIRQLFPCPSERITLPDQRDHIRAQDYREGLSQLVVPDSDNKFVFLFFQHLRKAGGTNFCGLAQKNLAKPQVPKYYCMPDMYWDKKRCAGCFLSYSNKEIQSRMMGAGHRILGNEWDNFDQRFFDLPAIFATSFRRPLDRALSQFRFECIEDRGCKFKQVEPWWEKRKDLKNVYTWTFSAMPLQRITKGKTKDDAKKRQNAMRIALDTVAKYNLVLVMEWLAYAPEHVRDVLGYQDTTTMTERIRPHINQAARDDGQEKNQLGAAGIAKASWTPENYLSREQYKIMSEDLALDEILTDAARRIFLERVVCPDMQEINFISKR